MKRKEELLRFVERGPSPFGRGWREAPGEGGADEMFHPHPPFGVPLPEGQRPSHEIYRVGQPVRALGILLLCLFLSTVAFAEVIDRIVAVVDGQIITLSDLRREREIRAMLQEKPIDDDRVLARQLVDARLIERQIADYPNIEVTEDEINADVRRLSLYQVPNPRDSAGRALADAQGHVLEAPAAPILDAIRSRIRSQKFFDVKFRQSIRPTEEEVRKYYQDVFLPAARARGMDSVPPLTDRAMADAIRDNVIQENLDHEVDVWLEAIRRRSKIEVFE